ncbi:hypothetical protein AAZX31_20G074800 [Glycine max]
MKQHRVVPPVSGDMVQCGTSLEETYKVTPHVLTGNLKRCKGLALFKKLPYNCQLINFSQNFIYMKIFYPRKPCWRLTGFYGFPERVRRKDSWDLLKNLARDNSLPWFIISHDEKKDTIIESNQKDIPMKGHQFIWAKSRGSPYAGDKKLDQNELNSVVHSTFQQPLFNDIISKFHLYANELFEWGKKVRSIFWHEITECKCEIELVQSEISLQLLHAL